MPISPTNPRIYQNGRVAYMTAQRIANSQAWQDFQADKPIWTGTDTKRIRQYVWDWASDPTAPKLAALLAAIDAKLAKPVSDNMENRGLVIGDWIEDMAFAYDWAKADLGATRQAKMEDYMILLILLVYNSSDPWVHNVYPNEPWANDNPENNYFPAMFKGVVFAWLAMYGAIPATVNYPYGDPTARHTWRLKDLNGQWTQDLGSFIDQWMTDRVIPVLDEHFAGGAWHEGVSYGPGPYRHYFDMFRAVKDAGGTDYAAGKTWWADRIMYCIYSALPGNQTFERGELGAQGHMGSMRISVLQAVDELRVNDPTNPVLQYGQYWLNSGYSNTRYEPKASWNYGHDFFWGNFTVPGLDYKPIIPKFWYAEGSGQYISRKDFGANDVAVGASCFWITQDHADHDQTDVQIWRSGHGGPLAVDGWLLCDMKHGGGGKYWESFRHNCHTIGAGARPYTRGFGTGKPVPSMGYQQRFGDQGPPSVASVQRHWGNSRFSYVRMEANNAYRPIENQGSVNCWWDQDSICDVCTRSEIHLRQLDIVILFDKVRQVLQWADPVQPGKDLAHFHYPKVEPLDLGTGVRRVTNYNNRMFRQFLLPGSITLSPPSTFTPDEIAPEAASSLHAYRETVDVPRTYHGNPDRQVSKLLTLLHVGDSTALTAIVGANVFENQTSLEGCTLKIAGAWWHTMFSAMQDLSTGPTLQYVTEHGYPADRHVIMDLVPNANYTIKREFVSGSLYLITLNQGGTVTAVANSGGLIEFTTSQLMGTPQDQPGGGGKKIPTDPNA